MIRTPCLAAITLEAEGGGIAGASRLLWRAMRDEWGPACRLITLNSSSSIDNIRFGAQLAALQATGRSSLVLYSHLSLAQVQRYLPRSSRAPYGIFLHGIEAWRPIRAEQRRAIEQASILMANSHYTAARVADAHPWIGPIVECPLALEPSVEPVAGDDAGEFDRGAMTVLSVGRMLAAERYKGHDQLLEAWGDVVRSFPRARLILAGDGDDRPRLERKAASLGLRESVTFPGFVSFDVLDRLYREAAVFAMPSREEGFGLVYLEAMARTLPCIGSIHDAAGEVIEDGVTGCLVEQSNIAQLSDALKSLLANPEQRRKMGIAGLRRLHERFTYSRFRSRFVSLISDASPELSSSRRVLASES